MENIGYNANIEEQFRINSLKLKQSSFLIENLISETPTTTGKERLKIIPKRKLKDDEENMKTNECNHENSHGKNLIYFSFLF